jgi:hypothetical protein
LTTTSSVVFKKKRYAVLDGTTSTHNPQNDGLNQFFAIPQGWKIATKTAETQALLTGTKFRFGCHRVVLADGTMMSTNDKKTLGFGKLEQFTSDNGVTFVRPSIDTSVGTTVSTTTTTTTTNAQIDTIVPNAPETKILITQDTTASSSWSLTITPTNYVTLRENNNVILYAVMDNTQSTSTSAGCQGVPMALPAGWSLAERTATFESHVVQKLRATFGTECLVFADGTGLLTSLSPNQNDRFCGSNLIVATNVDGQDLFTVPDCTVNRRIIIQQRLSLDQLSPQSACGICKSWGDPHVEQFGPARINLFHAGQYVYIKPVPSEPQDFVISGRHDAFSGVASHGAVYIDFIGEKVAIAMNPGNGAYTVTRNGKTVDLKNEDVQAGSTYLTNKDGQVQALLPNGILVQAKPNNWNGQHFFDVTYVLPNSLREKTFGLCGYCGGQFANKLVSPNGQSFDVNLNNDQQQSFGDSWKYTPSMGTAKRSPVRTESSSTATETHTVDGVTTTTTTTTSEFFEETTTVSLGPVTTFTQSPLELCKTEQFAALAKQACSILQTQHDIDSCLIDTCVSGSLNAVHTAREQSALSVAFDLNGGEGVECNEVPHVNHTVEFQGMTFATIDNAHPTLKGAGGQEGFFKLPEGWELAPHCPLARAFISQAHFGTGCFALADGTSLTRDLDSCHHDQEHALDTVPGGCHKPRGKGRVLIIKKSLQGLIPADQLNFKSGWEKIGEGFALSTDTVSAHPSSKAMQVTASEKETRGAKLTIPYNSKQRFNLAAWSKCLTPQPATPGSTYSLTVELIDEIGNKTLGGTVEFNSTVSHYHLRSVDVVPTKVIKTVIVTLKVSGFEKIDSVFSDLTIRPTSKFLGGNILKDGTLQTSKGWKPLKGGFNHTTVHDNTHIDASGSLKVNCTGSRAGAWQKIVLAPSQKKNLKGIYFRGDSKIIDAKVHTTSSHAIHLDVIYDDGTQQTGIQAHFNGDQGKWLSADRIFRVPATKTVKEINFATLLDKLEGSAVFDNLFVTFVHDQTHTHNTADHGAGAFGASHIHTFSGHKFRNHHVGDHVLFHDGKLGVYTRHVPHGEASVIGSVLFNINGTKIQIERNHGSEIPFIAVNDQPKQLVGKSLHIGNLGTISLDGTLESDSGLALTLDLPTTEHKITVSCHSNKAGHQFLQVIPQLPTFRLKDCRGLLGSKEFGHRDSTDIKLDLTKTQHLDQFISSWKFEHAGFSSFNKLNNVPKNHPIPEIKTVASFPAHKVEQAKKACDGVFHKDQCCHDLLTTGDHSFVSALAATEGTDSGPQTQAPAIDAPSSSDSKKNLIIILSTVLGGVALLALVAVVVAIVIVRRRRNSAHGSPVLMS